MSRKRKKTKLYSALEVANICGVVNQTAINWIRKGTIKAFVTPGGQYRIYPNDLVQFLVENNMRIPEELLEYLQSPENLQKASIVLVTDNNDLFHNVDSFLDKKHSIELYRVNTPRQAMRAISAHNPEFVLIDASTVGEDVVDLLTEYIEQLQNNEIISNCELILITDAEELPNVIDQRYNVA